MGCNNWNCAMDWYPLGYPVASILAASLRDCSFIAAEDCGVRMMVIRGNTIGGLDRTTHIEKYDYFRCPITRRMSKKTFIFFISFNHLSNVMVGTESQGSRQGVTPVTKSGGPQAWGDPKGPPRGCEGAPWGPRRGTMGPRRGSCGDLFLALIRVLKIT